MHPLEMATGALATLHEVMLVVELKLLMVLTVIVDTSLISTMVGVMVIMWVMVGIWMICMEQV